MADLATSTTFQDRMFERVKESLSELLTPEEAKALVEKAIQDSLFKPRIIKQGYNESKELPSVFAELVGNQVKEEVSNALKEWLAEHHEEVTAAITEALKDGIVTLVVSRFKSEMQQPMYALGGQVQQVINKLGGI
jgi:hypothetical protein